MRITNFINLSVVAGFFIGLIIGLLKYDEPELILFVTLVVTVAMYLISLTMSALYIYMINPQRSMLANKHFIEERLEYFDSKFDHTEEEARSISRFIKNLDLTNNEPQEEIRKA